MKNKKLLAQKQFLEKKLMLKYLLYLNSAGIFALVNEKDKKILIKSSNNIYKSLSDTVANIQWYSKELNKDKKKLQIRILAMCPDDIKDAYKLQHITQYKAQGYTLYNKERLPLYKARVRLIRSEGGIKALVEVISSGKRVYPIVTFDTKTEADNFIANNEIYDILKARS